MRKFLAVCLALALCLVPTLTALADDSFVGEVRTVIGADLSASQIEKVYQTFGVERGTVTELSVTNGEERVYLEGKIDDKTIGTRSISCVYIETLPEGAGLTIQVSNINWCTEAMYRNALITAGIYDAKVIVTAPFAVSGTAALTGLYKAYEDLTGKTLSDEAKNVGTSELILSAELADELAGVTDEEIAYLINELKAILDQTKGMTDAELKDEITFISKQVNITLNDEQMSKVVGLVRSMEKLSVDDLIAKAKELRSTVLKVQEVAQKTGSFIQKVVEFFGKIADFFSRLFGGK